MKERKGAASLYVVIFATILFGIITLSFIRIILSESTQTTNDDLSQSAYDSALAGVEDAKVAIDRYYQCLSSTDPSVDCKRDTLFKQNCQESGDKNVIGLAQYLYPSYVEGEVKIQESSSATNSAEQAYTCVIISDITDDYRSTLTSDTRTRVVPISINGNKLDNIERIEFSWYSEVNGTVFKNLDNNGKFSTLSYATTPPTISLSILATTKNFDINSFNSDSNLNFSTAVLLPSSYNAPDSFKSEILDDGSFPADNKEVDKENTISSDIIKQNAQASSGNSSSINNPKLVYCTHSEFACTVSLEITEYLKAVSKAGGANDTNWGEYIRNGNLMLVVSMPYGDIVTDFVVRVYEKGETDPSQFDKVQIKVDSTGRANQLVRRVETRLDPADIFFPYPQYALELTGDSNDPLKKYFWITNNCWTEKGYCNNNGAVSD